MPTAIKVKDEKNANTMIVRFETSTSPSWKDIKIFIKLFFDLYGSCEKDFFSKTDYKFKRITTTKITR